MKVQNEFIVDAPIEQTWPVLLDIPRVATCLPGASMEPGGEDGVFRGSMKIKLGPVTTSYQGTVRLEEVDEDTHTARLVASAKEQKGQGTASATITNHLEDIGGRTRVVAVTDLAVTGRPAQFGRGIMEDVAGKMLGEFATRFEEELRSGDGAPAGAPQPAAAVAAPAPAATARAAVPAPERTAAPEQRTAPDVLDLGQAVAGSAVTRIAAAGAAAVAGLVVAGLLRKRGRRGIQVNVKYRW